MLASIVLPLSDVQPGHRLGVNSLALDHDRSILYSAGRDGALYAWNLNIGNKEPDSVDHPCPSSTKRGLDKRTCYEQHVQAHSHWINDLALVHNNHAVVSCSSDASVKIWTPHSHLKAKPQTIGFHKDYVKCVASPNTQASWVVAGGLDRRICIWDLKGKGQQLQIDVGDEDSASKGSVYALTARDSLIASGGTECVVKLWDARSGRRITKFVGHTDNIRSILISEDSSTIITASSDQTIKVWSTVAGRCLYNFSMHNDSVWSLYSDHPNLAVFYSGDRSGLVSKTDTRGSVEIEQGISVGICKENKGINKVVRLGDFIWTATAMAGINRWADGNTCADVQMPDNSKTHRWSSISQSRTLSSSQTTSLLSTTAQDEETIPLTCILRLSYAPGFPPMYNRDRVRLANLASGRTRTGSIVDYEQQAFMPLRTAPVEIIKGQNGLIKHVLLNDRRHVLTLDTSGEVVMWDILRCIPIKSFGQRLLEDVASEINTPVVVAHWCSIDTRTGVITCVLDSNTCFDAEIYADEIEEAKTIEFKADQRINFGKWVLRYLFAKLIDEEIRRDEAFRSSIDTPVTGDSRTRGSTLLIDMPSETSMDRRWHSQGEFAVTPRAYSSSRYDSTTPGISIAVATPGVAPPHSPNAYVKMSGTALTPPSTLGCSSLPSNVTVQQEHTAKSDKVGDYFAYQSPSIATDVHGFIQQRLPTTPTDNAGDSHTLSPSELEKQSKEIKDSKDTKDSREIATSLGKRLRIQFTPKKSSRPPTSETKESLVEEKSGDSEHDEDIKNESERELESFRASIASIRGEYENDALHRAGRVTSLIVPSLPMETPMLEPPPLTTIILQEERPDSGGVADLFDGYIQDAGRDCDAIEKFAPAWLGDVLLRNRLPTKELVKLPFMLKPYRDGLPNVTNDNGEERLSANRVLRIRKLIAYIAERLESTNLGAEPQGSKLEERLELLCQDQVVPLKMTLATVKSYIWHSGGDLIFYYRLLCSAPRAQVVEVLEQ